MVLPTIASVIFWFIVFSLFTLATAIPSYLWQRIRNKKTHSETIVIMRGHFATNLAITKRVAFWLPKTLWEIARIIWFLVSSIPFIVAQSRYIIRANSKQRNGE